MFYIKHGHQSLSIHRTNNSNCLSLTYLDCSVRTQSGNGSRQGMEFACLIGIKYVQDMPVLILGVQSQTVFMMGSARIFELKRISFVAVASQKQQQRLLRQRKEELQQLQVIFEAGFHYYSDQYDLSLPFVLNKVRQVNHTQRKYYNQFVWNYNLAHLDGQKDQLQADLFYNWSTKLIQGYAHQFSCPVPKDKVKYILVSRRSHKKAGTRFYARGIDDKGNVANFAQTQQIMYLGAYIFSHIQIRGSVPAFFAQVGVNGLTNGMVIERTPALTKYPFHLHFATLQQLYQKVLAINLLTQKKPQQALLIQFFERLVSSQASKMPYLKYQYYDFHQECKNNKFQNSQTLISNLSPVIQTLSYNCYQIKTNKLIQQQKGVFRTNCLDCLDRTNYIQSRIALKVCKMFIERYSNEEINSLCKEGMLIDFPVNQEYPLARGFNQTWADNGDAVSLLYTGIGSTHTDITRTGGRTLAGTFNHKFRSLTRFFTQFSDHVKHEAITKITTPTCCKPVQNIISDFQATVVLSIDNQMPIEQAIGKIGEYATTIKPIIIVVYIFQKRQNNFFSKLTCYLNSQVTDFKIWDNAVCKQLEGNGYIQIGSVMAERCWMGVFCLQNTSRSITEVKQEDLSKNLSRGEALLLKMKLQHSSFIFAGINCQTYQDYLQVFDQIHQKGFQISKLGVFKSTSFLDVDYRVIIGHSGSHMIMEPSKLRTLKDQFQDQIQKNNLSEANKIIHKILDWDEFGMQQNQYKNKYSRQYEEPPVHFIPSSNRMVFWNAQSVILRVREYQDIGRGSIVGILDYEIGRTRRSSLFVPQ